MNTDSRCLHISFDEPPIPAKGVRFSNSSNSSFAYNPDAKQKERLKLLAYWQLPKDGETFFPVGALFFFMLAKFELPKSLSKKRKEQLLGQPHTHKPDCDNLEKIYFDCLKGLVYKDDAQISMSLTRKVWGKESGVSIFVGDIDVYYEVLMDHFMTCTICKKLIPVNEIGICLGCQTGTPNLYEEMLLNNEVQENRPTYPYRAYDE